MLRWWWSLRYRIEGWGSLWCLVARVGESVVSCCGGGGVWCLVVGVGESVVSCSGDGGV